MPLSTDDAGAYQGLLALRFAHVRFRFFDLDATGHRLLELQILSILP